MISSKFIKVCLAILIIGFVGLLIQGIGQRGNSPLIQNQPSSSPIIINGFSSTTYDEDRLIAKISADVFKISPRKFFIFNLKSVNEAVLTNVQLDLHLYDGASEGLDLLDFLGVGSSPGKKRKIKLKGVGFVTRGVIRGFILKVYKMNKLSIMLKGEKAILDFKKGEMKAPQNTFFPFISNEIQEL